MQGEIKQMKNAGTIGWTICLFCRWKMIKYWKLYMAHPNNISVYVDLEIWHGDWLPLLGIFTWSPNLTDEGSMWGNQPRATELSWWPSDLRVCVKSREFWTWLDFLSVSKPLSLLVSVKAQVISCVIPSEYKWVYKHYELLWFFFQKSKIILWNEEGTTIMTLTGQGATFENTWLSMSVEGFRSEPAKWPSSF